MSRREVVYVQQSQSQALPALANVFIPGLGHLIQGRTIDAFGWWIGTMLSALGCFILIGFVTTPILWVWCIVDAARWNPDDEYEYYDDDED